MRRQLIVCVVACITLISGCRTEYLAEPRVLEKGLQARSQLEQSGRDPNVAVQVRPVDPDAGPQPPQFVGLSALRVDKRRADAPWRVSARDRVGLLAGGSILLTIGLASIAGGVLGLSLHTPCMSCSSDSRSIGNAISQLFAGAAIAGGILELIPGAVMIGVGTPRVEIPAGVPGMVYVPETPAESLGRNR